MSTQPRNIFYDSRTPVLQTLSGILSLIWLIAWLLDAWSGDLTALQTVWLTQLSLAFQQTHQSSHIFTWLQCQLSTHTNRRIMTVKRVISVILTRDVISPTAPRIKRQSWLHQGSTCLLQLTKKPFIFYGGVSFAICMTPSLPVSLVTYRPSWPPSKISNTGYCFTLFARPPPPSPLFFYYLSGNTPSKAIFWHVPPPSKSHQSLSIPWSVPSELWVDPGLCGAILRSNLEL